ncbi:RagB/SusD family nutrient uptake outer membrane protein [Massilibacteroides sp.]|uniref:RagB/SusD family nutrient uptake outer membrane protein n=1 Tax=Massilibacteroides sp. TaxID=2034766 RepID=UPI002639BFD8|nr:RagB/SusD family nutrient uptake outer membrane protein [Massilibacteroides sp.]MDD4515909.1 RagB/SusD family nutrient uptake outer membrane protein [Massilibacteroides sp.]
MKKYKSIILSIAAIIGLSGCYDLDRYPYDQVSSGTFWKTESQAKQAMMGVYNVMKNENAFGITFGLDCLSDIGVGYDNPGYVSMYLGTYTGRTSQVSSKWQTLYDGVMRSNTVLQNLSTVDMTDELKVQYTGEAKFMRALYYFSLMTFYGGVPLYDESWVVDQSFNEMMEPRATEEKTREFILNDLEAAINALPVKWDDANYGRATKGAAHALRGKVLLYNNQFADAAKSFEEIVNDPSGKGYGYALYNNYENLFKPEGDQSSEMIFAIQNSGGVGMDYGMPMTFYMGSRSSFGSCWNNVMASTGLADMYEYKDGKPFNWNEIIPGFNESKEIKDKTFRATLSADKKTVVAYPESKDLLLDMYANRDPRMGISLILPYTEYKGWVSNKPKICEFVVAVGTNESNGFIRNNKQWDTYLWRKFVAEHDMDGQINNRAHTPINFPLIRYADVLLMLAECYNETDRQTEAVTLINQVRQRPSVELPALNSGPAWLEAKTKEEIFNRIKQERAVELAGEGHRFHDLRRWKELLALSGKEELSFAGTRLFTRVVSERDYLWPIPSTEIEKNDKLTQNPGWD